MEHDLVSITLWSQEYRRDLLPLNKAQRKTLWEAGRSLTEPATPAATITFPYAQSCCTLHQQSPSSAPAHPLGQAPLLRGPRATERCAGCATRDPTPAAIAPQPSPGPRAKLHPHRLLPALCFTCSPSGTWSGNRCPKGHGRQGSPERPWDASTTCEKAAPSKLSLPIKINATSWHRQQATTGMLARILAAEVRREELPGLPEPRYNVLRDRTPGPCPSCRH